MATIGQSYRAILRQELRLRKKFNRKYSLRAFARFLGLAPDRLFSVLNGDFGLSLNAAQKLAERLGFSEQQAGYFCDLVESEHARSPSKRALARSRVLSLRRADLWPKHPPALELAMAHEMVLWGRADPGFVAGYLKHRGESPFLSPEAGGMAQIGLMVRKGFERASVRHEFCGAILVADILSTTGYGLFAFGHLTDSVHLIESRKQAFERSPKLSTRIEADFLSDDFVSLVEDEDGTCLFESRIGGIGKGKRESKHEFSLVTSAPGPDGQVDKVRVTGTTRIRQKKLDPDHDSFWIRPGSKSADFLKRACFRPVHWRFYRSSYDYFRLDSAPAASDSA